MFVKPMGILERKDREKKKMRGLILKTAMKLFLEEGFENVTVRRIAERIEYSPAAIYLYYKDKDEILYAIHEIGFEKLYKQQQTILSIKNPWKRLKKHGSNYINFALENHEYYDLMFIMRGPAKKIKEKEEWEIGLRSFEFLKKNINECIKAGYLSKVNLDVAAFAFWSLTHGIASRLILC
ncbi:MAG: TetR/AcrR family transcriptional regulator [Nitrospirae bacterium]|nr:TetR/AcrR family transcriptional regulator [Nitrospirota bacterium]